MFFSFGGQTMKNRFVLVMKWTVPIVSITIGILHFADIIIPKWLLIVVLFILTVLYTAALIIEKRECNRK